MAGLIDNYGCPVAENDVILHCNFLWMSSKQHDLQTDKEFTFNHAELVPQFHPKIPCYRESISRRLGIAIGHRVPFFSWTRHMRIAYFEGNTLPKWTIDHPRANPTAAVTLELPSPNEPPSPPPIAKPWTEKRLARFNPEWVNLKTAFQWKRFQYTIETLQRRGNRVLVLIGPFNEHMLTPEGLKGYKQIESEAVEWFRTNRVDHFTFSTLPSECFADASHPLAEGYEIMARDLLDSRVLRDSTSIACKPTGSQGCVVLPSIRQSRGSFLVNN